MCRVGTGDECTGYGRLPVDEPGLHDVRTEDPNLPLYHFPDGVEVSIEITAVDGMPASSSAGTLLDTVGETAVVNT